MAITEDRNLLFRKVEEGQNPTDGTEHPIGGVSIADEELAKLVIGGRDDPDDQNVLGFGTMIVPGFATGNITVNPMRIFRPNRLLIPERVANSFMVCDLKIGKNSQLLSTLEIPAMTFGE